MILSQIAVLSIWKESVHQIINNWLYYQIGLSVICLASKKEKWSLCTTVCTPSGVPRRVICLPSFISSRSQGSVSGTNILHRFFFFFFFKSPYFQTSTSHLPIPSVCRMESGALKDVTSKSMLAHWGQDISHGRLHNAVLLPTVFNMSSVLFVGIWRENMPSLLSNVWMSVASNIRKEEWRSRI